jgi:acetyl-CoA acetyltransferase
MTPNVTVIGAGSWGTTLASMCARRGPTTIWALEDQVVEEINTRRSNNLYLQGFELPTTLRATRSMEEATRQAEVVVMAVPSPHFRAVLEQAAPFMGRSLPVVSVTKGIEPESLLRMTEVIAQLLPHNRRAVLSGVGQSQIGRRLFRTDMDLTAEAALAAIADAGLTPDDVDGIASYPGAMVGAPPGFAGPGIVDVQDALGLSVDWHLAGPEGPAQISPVIAAALAVAAGLARHVLVYRTVSEATAAADTGRLGIGAGSRDIRGFGAFLIPYGAMSAANWIACMAVRHMHEFGTTREQLGAIALTARRHAALNPASIYRDPMTMDDYLAARMVTWPFDSTIVMPCDGRRRHRSSADVARDRAASGPRTPSAHDALGRAGSVEDSPPRTPTPPASLVAHRPHATDDVADLRRFQLPGAARIEGAGFCAMGEAGRSRAAPIGLTRLPRTRADILAAACTVGSRRGDPSAWRRMRPAPAD